MNIFEMGNKNSDQLKACYVIIRDKYEKQGSLCTLEAFTKMIESEWTISINMPPERILRFLTLGYCDSIHGYIESLERTIEKTSDIVVDQEAVYRALLKSWKDKRIAFEQKFDGGDRFKYGALNFSKIGIIGKYGYFYVILERLKIEQYLSLVFIMYDSLRKYVDNNCCVNIGQLAQEIANKDHVQILSSIKHEGDIGSTPDYDWPKMICNDDNYIEAIIQDEIRVEHIGIVYIKRSKFDELYNDIFNKLADGSLDGSFVKSYLSDLNTIFEKMDPDRVRWGKLNE